MQDHENLFALGGRRAVITGAAQGIGEAAAHQLAMAGADLALCDRSAEGLADTAEACRDLGADVAEGVFDARDPVEVATWVEALTAARPRLDILVNNVGGGFVSAFLDVSEKGQAALVHENFTSVTNFIRAVTPHMPPPGHSRLDGGGSIVNVTSIEAHRAAPGYAVYAAMKAAVENLTRSLALELGSRHIRVNCVAPDVIPTPGVGEMPVHTPLPYAGHVDDVAAAVLYLASDASTFVTGVTLPVDGGNLAAAGWRRGTDGTYHT